MSSHLRGFFRRNIEEIAADPILRVYGSILAVVHVLTFVNWHRTSLLRRILSGDGVPICWPFFEECHRFRILGPAGVDALLWGYVTLAVAALLLFQHGRWTDLDLSLRSRVDNRQPLATCRPGFCRQPLTYDLWRPNPWILR